MSVCDVQNVGRRNAVFIPEAAGAELCDEVTSFGEMGEGDEMNDGSKMGIDRMVMYRSRSACVTSIGERCTILEVTRETCRLSGLSWCYIEIPMSRHCPIP